MISFISERAKRVVEEINKGLWHGEYHNAYDDVMIINHQDSMIWVRGGGFFCGIYHSDFQECRYQKDAFGIIGRHLVYRAAKKIIKKAKEEGRKQHCTKIF